MSHPSVAVVIITYNASRFFKNCIESVLNQTLQPSQILVCDDASQDDTQMLIKQYADLHPKLIHPILHTKNLGIPKNINSGLNKIKTDYVSIIGGDDVWHEDKLLNEVTLLANGVDAVYSACGLIDENGQPIGHFQRKYDGLKGNVLFEMLMHEMTFRSPLLKMSILDEIGHFNEHLDIYEDWDLKIRYVARATVEYAPATTVFYRKHTDGISKRSDPWTYYRSLKQVYKLNKSLIKGLNKNQASMVLQKQNADLLRLLFASYAGATKKDKSLIRKIIWYKELLTVNPREGFKLLLRKVVLRTKTKSSTVIN